MESQKKNEKISPCVALPFIKDKIKKKKIIKKNNILLVPTVIDFYLFKNELRRIDKVNYDLLIFDNFIKNLSRDNFDKLIFKPHPIEIRKIKEFSYYQHVKNNYPKIKLIDHSKNLYDLIDSSIISVFLYLATPFLSNLVLNKPSIFIYHFGFERL